MLINQLYYPEGSSCLHLFSCPDLVLLEGGVWGEHIERWPHHSSLNLFIYWLCVLPSQQLDLGNLGLTPVTYWLCDHGLSFLTSKMKELDLSTPEILTTLSSQLFLTHGHLCLHFRHSSCPAFCWAPPASRTPLHSGRAWKWSMWVFFWCAIH